MVSQTWSIILVTMCALQISVIAEVKSSNEAYKISSLPGQPNVTFQQYSGYITVDETQSRSYFFYFAEAETDQPTTKPLVLWLNGGPGCSSLGAGAFSEHGPFRPSGNGLVRNNYSWNREANMLYLESPAGVGFSYSGNTSFYESVTDDMTARDNYKFLLLWLEKFPEFKNTDLFISGESYAGHYVPQLAHLIIQSKPKLLNLKGISIGNGLLDHYANFNPISEYLWSHGLISDSTFDQLTNVCNYSEIIRQNVMHGSFTPECSRVYNQILLEKGDLINDYDVTRDFCLPSALKAQSRVLINQTENEAKLDVCVWNHTEVYLNRKDVQKAFHAQLVGVKEWGLCSEVVKYDAPSRLEPTSDILGKLVMSGVRVLVYSGDQDSVVPLTGTRKICNGLAKSYKLNTTQQYRPWIVDGQVAGWTQVYDNMLTYATVRGASHLAPFTNPDRSLVLLASFLAGKPLPTFNGTK